MVFFSFVTSVILITFSLIDHSQGKVSLTTFGKKVQKFLPKDIHDELFAVNADSDDQLLDAVQMATEKFDEALGTSIDDDLAQKVYDEFKRFGKNGLNSTILFYVYTNALTQTFTDEEVLTETNVKEVAHKYVNELKKSAMSLKDENITSTLPALNAANARLLKSVGVTSKGAVNQFTKNTLHEFNKYLLFG